MLKQTTRAHLKASKRQPRDNKSNFLASLKERGSKDAAKLIRKSVKQRKAIASDLRSKRKEHGAHLTRLWHRAGN